MELRSSQGGGTGHNVDHEVNNEQEPYHDAVIVLFNLDMTDLKTINKEICQIAASCKGKMFQVYIMPDGHDIAINATSVHGITVRRRVDGYKLFQENVHGWKMVKSFSPKEGLTKFLDFLSDLTGQTRKVLLAAHGCSSFQRHMLQRQLKECNLFDAFQSLVLGTIDTIEVIETKLKSDDQETKKEKEPYDLESLATKYIEDYGGGQRNAQRNVEILESLIEVIGCTDAVLKKHVKDLDVFIRSTDIKNYLGDAVSSNIREKIASAGITIDVLKDEYKTNGSEGISKLLQEKKVTKHKKVIQKLIVGLSCL